MLFPPPPRPRHTNTHTRHMLNVNSVVRALQARYSPEHVRVSLAYMEVGGGLAAGWEGVGGLVVGALG